MASHDEESSNTHKRESSHEIVQEGLKIQETSTEKSGPSVKTCYPPGYRFMPRDEELILYYLQKKVNNEKIPIDDISDVYLKQKSPKDLTETHPKLGDNEWYFFTPRDRKYPNGSRPNRAADTGYWKATGADKHVRYQNETIGFRKALVFYEGKAPRGVKTSWIMHEFRLNKPPRSKTNADDMRLDDWVLCRIYEKAARPSKRNRREQEADESVDGEGEMINNVCMDEHALNEEVAPELVYTNGDIAGFQNHHVSDEMMRSFGDDWNHLIQSYAISPHDESLLINSRLQSSISGYGLVNPVGQMQQNLPGTSAVLNQPLAFHHQDLHNELYFQQSSSYFDPSTTTSIINNNIFNDYRMRLDDSFSDVVANITDNNQFTQRTRRL